jgi:acetyl-CoA synthetase
LIEHKAVAEAAVVPAPDRVRLTTPKAYVALAPGCAPTQATAASIFDHVRGRLSAYERVRRIEFAELPKTASGKIRRVELRSREAALAERGERAEREFRIEDFPRGVGVAPFSAGLAERLNLFRGLRHPVNRYRFSLVSEL